MTGSITDFVKQLIGLCNIDPVTQCWNWKGIKTGAGYGTIYRAGIHYYIHRIIARIFLGLDFDDSDIFVCHHCDNSSCINPHHLFLGTALDNHLDVVAKGRIVKAEYCGFGHEFTPENTYRSSNGKRRCRACRDKYSRNQNMKRYITEGGDVIH